jgi:uncharacterized protein YcsI (UPF0317 family)
MLLETPINVHTASPREIREAVRRGEFTGTSRGMAPGHAQVSIVVLPRTEAYDFLLFSQRNPKPCPLLEVLDEGSFESRFVAPGADVRTDLPRYRVYRHGQVEAEVTDVVRYWRPDLVAFLVGCALSFDSSLARAGVPNRQLEERAGGTMFVTSIPCVPAGKFRGPLVVSMRPMPMPNAIRAVQITSRFQKSHGAPVHIGDPAAIGIRDITKPDFGQPVSIRDGEVPVFWACAVTTQAIALSARLDFIITQAPGSMMVTDLRDDEVTVF